MRTSFRLLCAAVTLVLLGSASVALAAEPDNTNELVTLIVSLLNEKDKDLRAVGLEQVRTEAKGPVATKQFAEQLPKLAPEVQAALLGALADRGDAAARTAVLGMLETSRDEAVRIAAIKALGAVGDAADLQPLLKLLTGGTPPEQAAAKSSLTRLPGTTVPAGIAAEMKHAPVPLRVTLIGILAARRALDTVPDLVTAAAGSDPTVRGAAMTALGQLAGPEHVAGMVRGILAAEKGREREAAEKAVMLVCSRISEPAKQAEPLLAALDKLSKAERTALLPALGRVGGAAALKVVLAALSDADPLQHETGLRALCNWPDASVAARLTTLVQSDEHPEHRTTALRALIRIAPLADGRTDAQKLELLQKALALCKRNTERNLVLQRASAVRTIETLRFLLPYLDEAAHAQQACESVVELAHHRNLREPHKAEFDRALDKVLKVSKDATVLDRANRYKKGQTWARPTATEQP